ncbi:MAG: hypothetical protein Q8O67_29885 [Deltaproteobacteria bacterium]|nr:hypothetical protein [Deltaproteobacteria bacterium]
MKHHHGLEEQPLSAEVQALVDVVWKRAQERWATAMFLSRPTGSAPDFHSPAAIDLRSRQIVINETMLRDKHLLDSLEGILAHEVGHHVAYPGTLVVDARLRLVERALLPFTTFSLSNLFTDFLINEHIGHDLGPQLAAVYVAFGEPIPAPDPKAKKQAKPAHKDFAFSFVMCAYEELWQLPEGSLLQSRQAALDERFPGARAEAQLLVERLFVLGPNLTTQFLFFLSVLSRYLVMDEEEKAKRDKDDPVRKLVDDAEPADENPCPCGGGDPSPEDWAEALNPTRQEQEAFDRALKEGWLREDDAKRLGDARAFERRVAGLPGQGTANASMVPEVMAAWYRRQAQAYLLRPPPSRLKGEATVPVDLVPWEPGDPVVDVDWPATLREFGPVLGKAQPLLRERVADEEGLDTTLWAPRTEIYVDVSGSMPDPRRARNALTLAAMILTVATVRAGGSVRALLYSSDHVKLWHWSRSDVEVSRFLMHYIGAGTDFPFPVLEDSVNERHADGPLKPIRVVITDRDFDHNTNSNPKAPALLQRAGAASAPFVLLQHVPNPACVTQYKSWGLTVVAVNTMEDFPAVAAGLARALFLTDPRPSRA